MTVTNNSADWHEFEGLRLDAGKRMLWRGATPLSLPPKALELLVILVENAGKLVRKDELMNRLWPDTAVEEGSLTQAIFQLRRTLGERPRDHRFIVTVPGQGYRFVASVSHNEKNTSSGSVAPAENQTIAVLPFRVAGVEPGDDYLGVGVADTLITTLSRESHLTLLPIGAVLHHTLAADPLAAGRQLGVDLLLHGTVQRAAGRIRISAALVALGDHTLRWADTLDCDPAGLFAAQDALAAHVLKALPEGAGASAAPTQGNMAPEAYQAFVRGRYFCSKRSAEGFRKAIGYFDNAISLDPHYARGHTGLADCYSLLACYGMCAPLDAWMRAREAAGRALALDAHLAEAHATMALVHMGLEWNWPAAATECARALELNPNLAMARDYLAELLMFTAQPTRALAEIHHAQALDPLSLIIHRDAAMLLYFERRHREAITQLHDTLELDPDFDLARRQLAACYQAVGCFTEALALLESTPSLAGGDPQTLGELGHMLGVCGRRDEASAILARLDAARAGCFVSPYARALVHIGLEEDDRALSALDEACDLRVWQVLYMGIEPRLDPLRANPRFNSLLTRVGLKTTVA